MREDVEKKPAYHSVYKEVAPEFYAVWRYDLFPYLSGGEVTHMGPTGSVYTKGYGRGYGFNPLKLVPLETGQALMTHLEALRLEKQAAIKQVDDAFRTKLTALLKQYNIPLPYQV